MRICISSQLTHSRKDHDLAEGKAGEQTKRVVELEYDCHPHPPSSSFFFLSWLSSRHPWAHTRFYAHKNIKRTTRPSFTFYFETSHMLFGAVLCGVFSVSICWTLKLKVFRKELSNLKGKLLILEEQNSNLRKSCLLLLLLAFYSFLSFAISPFLSSFLFRAVWFVWERTKHSKGKYLVGSMFLFLLKLRSCSMFLSRHFLLYHVSLLNLWAGFCVALGLTNFLASDGFKKTHQNEVKRLQKHLHQATALNGSLPVAAVSYRCRANETSSTVTQEREVLNTIPEIRLVQLWRQLEQCLSKKNNAQRRSLLKSRNETMSCRYSFKRGQQSSNNIRSVSHNSNLLQTILVLGC